MRVALVVPYFDTTDGAPPNETVARQETVRGLVGSLNRGGVSARGFQMHRERASVSVPGGRIDLAPGPGGSMAVARLLHRFFPRHGPAYWIPAVELWRMVVRWRPHVMHVMGIALHPNLALGRLVASRTNIGVVASFHGGLPPGAGPTRLVSAIGLRTAQAVVFTAPELAAPWVDARLVRASQVAIAMETSTLMEAREQHASRTRTGLEGDPLCLAVARTEPVKDPLTTLAGFALVAERLPRAHLHWFGQPGTLDVAVRAAAAALPGVAERVSFHGFRDHGAMADVYSAADYLLQSSRREWSGLAVMEAMACGAIPIVSNIPSFRQITGGGRAGYLFAPGDPRGMVEAVLSMEARGRLAERVRAQQHFRERLSFDALAAALTAIYSTALDRMR